MVVQPIATHQAQAQAQAQALQTAVNAGAQANQQQRNPFWTMQGVGGIPPPMLAAGLPGNFYPQMAAMAAAQENATAMVGTAKLGISMSNPDTNSSLVVRSSVRKFNVNGGIHSVAQWCRKTVEENLEWLVKLSKRHFPDESAVLLAYGDGCETLVLIDGGVDKMPADFGNIKKIGVGVSMAQSDDKSDESKLANQGVLQPSDSIWEHLRFEILDKSDKKSQKYLFIHTSMTVWSDSVEGRRRVLQVTTASPQKPFVAVSYKPNPMFEQQVLSKWKEQGSGARSVQAPEVVQEKVTLITFNPKELILLEKAFDNRLNSRDLKTKVEKYTAEDKKACQSVIRRAHAEFVMRGPPRKRRKKNVQAAEAKTEAEKPTAENEEVKEAPKSPAKRRKSEVTKKSATKTKKAPIKKEQDSDDEPISKMTAKTPSKKPRKSIGSKASKKTPKPKTPKSEETKSRRTKRSKAEPSPKKSSKSKARK